MYWNIFNTIQENVYSSMFISTNMDKNPWTKKAVFLASNI